MVIVFPFASLLLYGISFFCALFGVLLLGGSVAPVERTATTGREEGRAAARTVTQAQAESAAAAKKAGRRPGR